MAYSRRSTIETCLLETGGNSLLDLADYLTSLNVDFDGLAQPELRALLGPPRRTLRRRGRREPCALREPADRFGDMNRKGEPQRPGSSLVQAAAPDHRIDQRHPQGPTCPRTAGRSTIAGVVAIGLAALFDLSFWAALGITALIGLGLLMLLAVLIG